MKKKPKLSRQDKNALRVASVVAAETIAQSLRKYLKKGRWLGNNNSYRRKTTETIERDVEGKKLNQGHLCDYVVASAPVHCLDGWSFLGRAMDCHAHGDPAIARHLAYYAELRAALSILAAQAIGIFNRQHFVIQAPKKCHKLGSGCGTHVIVWLALRHRADLKRFADVLAEIIQAGGTPLREWLAAFGTGPSQYTIAQRWMRAWGVDLSHFEDDHRARNEASYRPTSLFPGGTLDAVDASAFMRDFWAFFEPSGAQSFEILDRYFLRTSLEMAFQSTTGVPPAGDPLAFAARIAETVAAIAPTGMTPTAWQDFLLRVSYPNDPPLLVQARGEADISDPGHHIQVIGRAALLLRVATGATGIVLREGSVEQSDLELWVSPFGEDHGLWGAGAMPVSLADLWEDVKDASGEIASWEITVGGGAFSYNRWWSEQSRAITLLGQCERIGLWGLSS